MEVSLAISPVDASPSLFSAVLDSSVEEEPVERCRVIGNGSGLVCLYDRYHVLIGVLEGHALSLIGAFFFRRLGARHVLSMLSDAEVFDFVEGTAPAPATVSSEPRITITPDDYVEAVCFVSSNGVEFGVTGGARAIVSVVERYAVRGCFDNLAGDSMHSYRWAFDADSGGYIALSSDRVVCATSPTVSAGSAVLLPNLGFPERFTIACVCVGETCIACVAQGASRKVWILCVGPSPSGLSVTVQESMAMNDGVEWAPNSRSQPQVCLKHVDGCSLAILVYPDAAVFGVLEKGVFVPVMISPNELSLPLEMGYWVNVADRTVVFATSRYDGAFRFYDIVLHPSQPVMAEVMLRDQATTPLRSACVIPVNGLPRLLCVASCVAVQRGEPRSMQIQSDDRTWEDVTLLCTVPVGDAIRFLKMVLIGGEYSFLCMRESGECLLVAYGTPGGRCIAKEEDPGAVSTCLAFTSTDDVVCVLGFSDGRVKLFAGSQECPHTLLAHNGPVDTIVPAPSPHQTGCSHYLSISCDVGTVCYHTSDTGNILSIFASPFRPLTSCYWNRPLGYMLAFSTDIGNVWHIPTCRLERVCTTAGVKERRGFDSASIENVLSSKEACTIRVGHMDFCGRRFFSLRLSVRKMMDEARHGDRLSAELRTGIALLLQGCLHFEGSDPLHEDGLRGVLGGLSARMAESQDPLLLIGCIALTGTLAEFSGDGGLAVRMLRTWRDLVDQMLQSTTSAMVLASYLSECFFSFYTLTEVIPSSVRRCFREAVTRSSSELLFDVITLLLEEECNCEGVQKAAQRAGKQLQQDDRVAMALCIMGCLVEDADAHASVACLRQEAAGAVRRLVAAVRDGRQLSSGECILLLGVAEGFPFVDRAVPCCEWLDQIATEAFHDGTDSTTSRLCAEALERIVSHDVVGFMKGPFKRYYASQRQWRPRLIMFLTGIVQHFPYDAYVTFPAMVSFLLSAVDPHHPDKTERQRCLNAVKQMLRTTVAELPCVSFQQHHQQLAVGQRNGSVVVYSLKTAGTVAAFRAHTSPVLCVAYSRNTASHDIAVVIEGSQYVQVWSAGKSTGALAQFFSSSSLVFKLVAELELSAPLTIGQDESLVFTCRCRLQWLSPQCIQFSSPWHGAVQLSVCS